MASGVVLYSARETPKGARVSHSRTSLFVLLFLLAALPLAQAADTVTGTVVDPSGRPISRAHVRVLDASGHEISATLADEHGHFDAAGTGKCVIEASLAGFETATAPCASTNVRLELAVAPVSENVVVTATSTPVPASQIGVSASVFTSDDLASRRVPMVADLLRTTPGAMVVRTAAPGGVTSLFVRGGESSYNKVLIDGIPINEPGGTFNFSNLTTDNLDRVEIVRGAQSALYGSDAMASVVQLFTKRANVLDAHPQVAGGIEGGTYSTYDATASVSGAAGRLDYMLGGTRLSTDNDGVNHKNENNEFTLNTGLSLGHGATLRAIGRAELQHSGAPGPTVIQPADHDAFFERHDGLGGVTLDQAASPWFHERLTYSYGVSNQVSSDLVADSSSDFTYDSTANLRRHFASYQADVKLGRMANAEHLVTILGDWNGERIHLVDRMPFDPIDANVRHSRNNFGGAVEEQSSWNRVFITLGARVEHNDNFGTAGTPRGSIVVVVHESTGDLGETRVHASGGTGIKEPTALQSFSRNPFFLGNPDLEPERSGSYEVGADQRFAHDRAKFEVTWFDNRFRNQITLVNSRYVNVSKTRAKGAEIALDVAAIRTLHVNGQYTFVDSSVVANAASSGLGVGLLRRPRHSGSVGAAWAYRRVSVNVNGVLIGHFPDNDFGFPARTLNPGYNVWSGRASVAVTKQLALEASVDNIADESYEEPLGYQALGRAARVGLHVTF
jgi:vitamin B12 transporter